MSMYIVEISTLKFHKVIKAGMFRDDTGDPLKVP